MSNYTKFHVRCVSYEAHRLYRLCSGLSSHMKFDIICHKPEPVTCTFSLNLSRKCCKAKRSKSVELQPGLCSHGESKQVISLGEKRRHYFFDHRGIIICELIRNKKSFTGTTEIWSRDLSFKRTVAVSMWLLDHIVKAN